MRTSPCHKCADRYVGCHSECAEYLDFLAVHKEEKETIRKNKEKQSTRKGFISNRQFAASLNGHIKNRVFKQTKR